MHISNLPKIKMFTFFSDLNICYFQPHNGQIGIGLKRILHKTYYETYIYYSYVPHNNLITTNVTFMIIFTFL